MKATKHLFNLAEEMAKEDLKTLKSFTESDMPKLTKWNLQELLEVKQALLKGRYYTSVESVSASGMSRVIKIAYIKGNKLHGVTDSIYKLAGCDKNRRIQGCGMDMLFQAQYNLFTALCPKHRYQDSMKYYNSF